MCCRSGTKSIPAMTKGALIIDCSTIDVESAKQAHALAAKHGVALGRRAGVGRHRRRQGRDADLHVRRRGQGLCGGKARAGEHGQEDRALRRRRRGAGGQDLQQHDPGHFHDRRSARPLRSPRSLGLSHQALFDVASTSSGQCWALTSYCPVPGPVPTSPANNGYKPGFASASDGEGPDAGAGCGQRRRRGDAAGQARAGNLQGLRRRRPWRGGFFRHHPARSEPRRKITET